MLAGKNTCSMIDRPPRAHSSVSILLCCVSSLDINLLVLGFCAENKLRYSSFGYNRHEQRRKSRFKEISVVAVKSCAIEASARTKICVSNSNLVMQSTLAVSVCVQTHSLGGNRAGA